VFYLAAAALLALGAGFVGLAFRSREVDTVDVSREKTAAVLYQERLDELRGEMEAGQIQEGERRLIEEELGAALLSDYPQPEVVPAPGKDGDTASALPTMVVSAALLVASALLVYSLVGDPAAMDIAGAEAVMQLDPAGDREALESWRERLAARTDDRPEDIKAWYLLGTADLKLGRFATAAEAFSMAHAAQGDDPSIDVLWLQARYLAGGQLDATSRGIAERILAANPSQPTVLEILAIEAYREGSFHESVGLLNRALSGALESSHRAALTAGFQEARARLGDLTPSVDVLVESGAPVPNGMTLFVIARPIGGGMPYAVVRRPAVGMPLTIRLDDAVSMNPAAPLSSAAEVEIVVRLSRSGTAMAHPGDWAWQSPAIRLADLGEPFMVRAALAPPAF
jgi:cytochrome c-type biogenesis protein CcmH